MKTEEAGNIQRAKMKSVGSGMLMHWRNQRSTRASLGRKPLADVNIAIFLSASALLAPLSMQNPLPCTEEEEISKKRKGFIKAKKGPTPMPPLFLPCPVSVAYSG